MTRLAVFVSTFGYIGRVPFAQGTVGSAAGVAIYLAGPPLGSRTRGGRDRDPLRGGCARRRPR